MWDYVLAVTQREGITLKRVLKKAGLQVCAFLVKCWAWCLMGTQYFLKDQNLKYRNLQGKRKAVPSYETCSSA